MNINTLLVIAAILSLSSMDPAVAAEAENVVRTLSIKVHVFEGRRVHG